MYSGDDACELQPPESWQHTPFLMLSLNPVAWMLYTVVTKAKLHMGIFVHAQDANIKMLLKHHILHS